MIRVSSKSRPVMVAGAIAGMIRESGRAEVQAIGIAAIHKMVLAIANAREYLLVNEIEIVEKISMVTLEVDGHERSAIRIEIIKT